MRRDPGSQIRAHDKDRGLKSQSTAVMSGKGMRAPNIYMASYFLVKIPTTVSKCI